MFQMLKRERAEKRRLTITLVGCKNAAHYQFSEPHFCVKVALCNDTIKYVLNNIIFSVKGREACLPSLR